VPLSSRRKTREGVEVMLDTVLTSVLGYGYIEARTDTTQQSGQTPDMEVEIKNITVYVNGHTESADSRRT
jgi:hypothetical protein